HDDPVLEALEVGLPVEALERVRRVVLEGAEEGLEAEVEGVGELPDPVQELRGVLLEHLLLVVALLDEVAQALRDAGEGDGARLDVLTEVRVDGLPVGVELDVPVGVVEVEHRVEGVVVELRSRALRHADISDRCCQNCPNPSWTRETSSAVPSSSNLYR